MLKNNCIHKVSIIVPAYNAEQYMEDCLDSLIRQTYKNVEIIIVDDGSTDSTGDICDVFQQYYGDSVNVAHCQHSGVSHARLTGIRKATGKYVVFVDSDDWVEKDYILSMLSRMEEGDIVAAGISREVLYESGNAVCEYNSISPGKYATDSERQEVYGKMLYCGEPYRFGVLPYICNKMFRKDLILPLLEKADKRIFDGEDATIVYQYLLLARRIVLTDECKYHYVNHKGSASLADSKDAYLNASHLYQELYACFEKSEYNTVLLMQLDYYMRRMIWKKDPAAYLQVNSFLFPYDKIKAGSKIILYGMGKVGNVFFQQIMQSRYCNIIAWADRDFGHNNNNNIHTGENIPRITPNEIKKYDFDYIVIAIQNKIISHNILIQLYEEGIDEAKIVVSDI